MGIISFAASSVNAQGSLGDVWSGFYAGGSVTAGMFSSETTDHWCYVACDGASLAEPAGAIGAAVGYDLQIGSLIVGGIADYMVGSFETEKEVSAPGNYSSYTRSTWDSILTVRARVGVPIDRSLVFVSAGVASVDVSYRHDYNFGPDADNAGYQPFSDRETGFAASVGIEHAYSETVSLSAEYLYIGLQSTDGSEYFTDLDSDVSSNESSVDYRSNAQLVRLGVNWRF